MAPSMQKRKKINARRTVSSVLSLIDLTPDGRREKEMGRNMFWVQHKEAAYTTVSAATSTGSGSQKT